MTRLERAESVDSGGGLATEEKRLADEPRVPLLQPQSLPWSQESLKAGCCVRVERQSGLGGPSLQL